MAMLAELRADGVRTVLVESPDRFARDLMVQLVGDHYLTSRGIALVPTTAPTFFTDDTPTARLIRHVLGAIAEFEKANLGCEAARGADPHRPTRWPGKAARAPEKGRRLLQKSCTELRT